MQTVLIVIHLMVVLALVGVVLLQRSEGGGLGIGGGSGFMTARGAANALTRTTGILALVFFVTSLALSILARYGEKPTDFLNQMPAQTEQRPTGESGGIIDKLGGADTTTTKPANDNSAAQSGASGTTNTAPASGASTAPATDAKAPANGAATAPASNSTAAPASGTGTQPQVPSGQ